MTEARVLRLGDRGDAVRELRQRLARLGVGAAPGREFDATTEAALRAFQVQRGLRVDGICGPETWGALIESSYRLGDRLLYLSRPMLRGDDVGDLQRQLNALGFDAGREDAILGPETEGAVRAFQRNAGIAADGVCGPSTLQALERVGGLAAGSVATVREREQIRREAQRLEGLRVFLASDPALASLAEGLRDALRDLGAIIDLDTSGDDAGVVAGEANRFAAGLFVALELGTDSCVRCSYFANKTFRSEGGFCVAARLTESLQSVLKGVEEPVGRTTRFLRETRMAAVVCEVVAPGDVEATTALVAHQTDVVGALVEGVRRGVEDPPAARVAF